MAKVTRHGHHVRVGGDVKFSLLGFAVVAFHAIGFHERLHLAVKTLLQLSFFWRGLNATMGEGRDADRANELEEGFTHDADGQPRRRLQPRALPDAPRDKRPRLS